MADNKDKRDGRDRSRIDANDPNEVSYVRSQFPNLSQQEVKSAIEQHGPDREKVMEYLRGKQGGGRA